MRWISIFCVLLLMPSLLHADSKRDQAYASFLSLAKDNAVGVVLTQVTFANDGKVQRCRILRSNLPYSLEASITWYVEQHWNNPFFAGETRFMPITFDQLPSYVAHWNDDMVPPPDPLAESDMERKLKLRMTFGEDGWIKSVAVVEASGNDSLDQQTEAWVQVHWHHDAFAKQVIDAPFRFEPPAPPPVVVKKVKPVVPVKPAEPVAIPAMRVQ